VIAATQPWSQRRPLPTSQAKTPKNLIGNGVRNKRFYHEINWRVYFSRLDIAVGVDVNPDDDDDHNSDGDHHDGGDDNNSGDGTTVAMTMGSSAPKPRRPQRRSDQRETIGTSPSVLFA
jgi:hypothetical protein